MFKMTLKKMLTLMLVLAMLVPVLVAVLLTYRQSVTKMNDYVDTTLKNSTSMIDYFLKSKADSALKIAQKYAQNEDLKQAFINKDKVALDALIMPIFNNLKEDGSLAVFEFGDDTGSVFTRGHNPDKFGDSKADNTSIVAALSGIDVSGFELGTSGLAIRAFVPIKNNDNIIGTFQVGFNDSVLTDIQNAINGGISLYTKDVLAKSSIEVEQADIGKQLTDPTIFQRVSTGESVKISESNYMYLYYPLYDTLHKTVIGMIKITQDVSFVNDFKGSTITSSAVLLIIVFIVSIGLSIILARFITKPISNIEQLIRKTTTLDLDANQAMTHLMKKTMRLAT